MSDSDRSREPLSSTTNSDETLDRSIELDGIETRYDKRRCSSRCIRRAPRVVFSGDGAGFWTVHHIRVQPTSLALCHYAFYREKQPSETNISLSFVWKKRRQKREIGGSRVSGIDQRGMRSLNSSTPFVSFSNHRCHHSHFNLSFSIITSPWNPGSDHEQKTAISCRPRNVLCRLAMTRLWRP